MSKKELIELLTELLGTLPQIVLRHIDILVKQGLTHKDIARASYYIYDVMGQSKTDLDKWGIKGLIPLYLDKANRYYDEIKRQKDEQTRQAQSMGEVPVREVSPQERRKIQRSIDISEL